LGIKVAFSSKNTIIWILCKMTKSFPQCEKQLFDFDIGRVYDKVAKRKRQASKDSPEVMADG